MLSLLWRIGFYFGLIKEDDNILYVRMVYNNCYSDFDHGVRNPTLYLFLIRLLGYDY